MGFLKNIFNKQKTISPPSVEDLEEAKKIFFDNSCSYFFMGHEGWLNTYKNYHISEEQENEWRSEFISYWISQLSVEDITAVHKLEAASAIEALPNLFSLAEKGDSFIKLWTADAIWSLKDRKGVDAKLKQEAADKAIKLWNSIINKDDVRLSENHKAAIPEIGIKNLGASSPEEYIINFAKRKLKEARK